MEAPPPKFFIKFGSLTEEEIARLMTQKPSSHSAGRTSNEKKEMVPRGAVVPSSGGGSSSVGDENDQGNVDHDQPTAPKAETKLNPLAPEWNPVQRAPEEFRCLFLTFSNGFPLTENQIFKFFMQKYGACVERVYVHWPQRRRNMAAPALFGKVIFRASYFPEMVLKGQKQSRFYVDGRPLWCKRFDASKRRIIRPENNQARGRGEVE